MFTECYGTQFRRAARALTKFYDEALKDENILLTQFTLLRALSRMGSATFKELAEEVVLDKTTISRNVKVINAAGWVVFEQTTDAREKRILLSEAGKAKVASATRAWKLAQSHVLEAAKEIFARDGKDPLIDTLEKLQALSLVAEVANIADSKT